MRDLMRRLFEILTLVAVLLLPLGMSAAPAAAQQQNHSASMPVQHCPEQAPRQHGKLGFVPCTMVCSAALPALGSPRHQTPMTACGPKLSSTVHQLHGLHPETATPPPRHS